MAMQKLEVGLLNACVISSVVPQSIFNLRNLSRRYLRVEPLTIGENTELGIQVRPTQPSEVGSDRLVNALGALVLYPGPLIIVDSGTAITLDVIGRDGSFEGGVIAPGVHLSMEALHAAAAKLPRIALQKPRRVVGDDTVSAMQSGILGSCCAHRGNDCSHQGRAQRSDDGGRHRRRRIVVPRRDRGDRSLRS
jgi:type III pantothenate kinase